MKNIKSQKFVTIGFVAVLSALIAIGIATNKNTAENGEKYLQEHGYTNVVDKGIYFWCPKGTDMRREFEATNTQGERVEGNMCVGMFFRDDKIDTKVIKEDKSSAINKVSQIRSDYARTPTPVPLVNKM